MTLYYEVRSVYGMPKRYLVGTNDAKTAVEALTGRKTLSDDDVRNLAKLGVECRNVALFIGPESGVSY